MAKETEYRLKCGCLFIEIEGAIWHEFQPHPECGRPHMQWKYLCKEVKPKVRHVTRVG